MSSLDQEKDKRHEQEELDIDCVSSSHHQKARICLFCQQGVGECLCGVRTSSKMGRIGLLLVVSLILNIVIENWTNWGVEIIMDG